MKRVPVWFPRKVEAQRKRIQFEAVLKPLYESLSNIDCDDRLFSKIRTIRWLEFGITKHWKYLPYIGVSFLGTGPPVGVHDDYINTVREPENNH